LDESGIKLWYSVLKQYAIRDIGGLATLELACIARDRATAYAAVIKRDGPMIRGKPHALLRHEREERALESRLLTKLGLNIEALHPGVGRPAGRTIGVSLEHFSDDDDPHAA
jgi:hypothetical protein